MVAHIDIMLYSGGYVTLSKVMSAASEKNWVDGGTPMIEKVYPPPGMEAPSP